MILMRPTSNTHEQALELGRLINSLVFVFSMVDTKRHATELDYCAPNKQYQIY